MEGENRPWSEVYWEAAQDWVDKDAAASILENTRSAFVAQKVGEILALNPNMALNRAEQLVKGAVYYTERIHLEVDACKERNLAKVKLEYIRMRANEWNNQEANHRAGVRT